MLKYFAKCLVKPDELTFNVDIEGNNEKQKKKQLEKKNQKYDDEEDETSEEEIDEDIGDDAIVEDLTIKENKKKSKDTVFGIPDGSDR